MTTWDELKAMSFGAAERSTDDFELWERYCYVWRDRSYRYSELGRHEAARYAKRHGLEPPYTDRPLEERDELYAARGAK